MPVGSRRTRAHQVENTAAAAQVGAGGTANEAAAGDDGTRNIVGAGAADGGGVQPTAEAAEAGPSHGDGQGGGSGADGCEAEAPTAEELKAQWQADQKLASALAQQGYGPEHAVRAAADAQAAAAKEAWLAAKAPIAVSRRMQYAEEALARAKRAQAKMEQSISQLDDDYECERASRVRQLADLRTRTRERQEHLAALTQEAAEEYPTRHERVDEGAVLGAREVLERQLGPALQEIWEQAPEGSELRGKLAEIMQAATSVHGYVSFAAARGDQTTDWYDIDANDDCYDGDDDHDGDGWDGWDDHRWGWHGEQHGDQRWQATGWHHAAWRQDGGDERRGQGGDMDLRDVQVPRWMRGDADARGGDRANKRGRRDEDDDGVQGRHANAAEVTDDHEAAARLQAQQHDAVTAARAASAAAATSADAAMDVQPPAPPTPTAEEHRMLEQHRRQVWDQAQAENVAVAYSEIAAMSSRELEEWAAENLV